MLLWTHAPAPSRQLRWRASRTWVQHLADAAGAHPSQCWQCHIYLWFAPSPWPTDWWFKVGMWSTQMSSSRRSLFSRIISLTTHFSLSVSWLCSRDLPVCLVWGLTAATLLDPPWCILFSLKLIRNGVSYSIGFGEKGVVSESCTWSEEKDVLLSIMNFWGFNVNMYRDICPATHWIDEMWKSNLVIPVYIKHRSLTALQHQLPDSNRFI